MVSSPYHGRESKRMAHPTGAEPYLSPNQPERYVATTHVIRIPHTEKENAPDSQKTVGTIEARNAMPAW